MYVNGYACYDFCVGIHFKLLTLDQLHRTNDINIEQTVEFQIVFANIY